MNRYILLIVLLSLSKTASADALDGLEILNTFLTLLLLASISAIVLIVSISRTIERRMMKKEFKVSIGINFSCSTLIVYSFIAMASFSPEVYFVCISIIVVSSVLIFLNFYLGSKSSSNDQNK